MRGAVQLLASMLACVTLSAGCSSKVSSTDTTTPDRSGAPTSAVQGVVDGANKFLGMLDDTQKKQAQRELTQDNATAWSNFPCGQPCRGGLAFGSLTDDQLVAAKDVLRAAMGTGTGVGYDQAMKILMADDFLKGVVESRPTQGTPAQAPVLPAVSRTSDTPVTTTSWPCWAHQA